jgi:hypothetical protein
VGDSVPQETISRLRELFYGFKEKWEMSDDVYSVYIDMCIDLRRLLTMVEFIEELPSFLKKKDDPRSQDVILFLLKKALGPEESQSKTTSSLGK